MRASTPGSSSAQSMWALRTAGSRSASGRRQNASKKPSEQSPGVVILTFELDDLPAWQKEFLREGLVEELPRFPAIRHVAAALGGHVRVERIPTPGDCSDGFFEAFWRRPEALLDPAVRSAQSMWALLEPGVEAHIVERLAAALESGAWDAEHGHLRDQDSFDGALRLLISDPAMGGPPGSG